MELKKKADRLDKAEKALVEKKKAEKAQKKENDNNLNPREEVKRIMAEEKFYDKNPEAESYRDKIESYQQKGLSLEEAYILASKQDKQIDESREVYGKSIVNGNTNSSEWVPAVDIDTYDRMTESQQNDYNSKMQSKYGKIKFK